MDERPYPKQAARAGETFAGYPRPPADALTIPPRSGPSQSVADTAPSEIEKGLQELWAVSAKVSARVRGVLNRLEGETEDADSANTAAPARPCVRERMRMLYDQVAELDRLTERLATVL